MENHEGPSGVLGFYFGFESPGCYQAGLCGFIYRERICTRTLWPISMTRTLALSETNTGLKLHVFQAISQAV